LKRRGDLLDRRAPFLLKPWSSKPPKPPKPWSP